LEQSTVLDDVGAVSGHLPQTTIDSFRHTVAPGHTTALTILFRIRHFKTVKYATFTNVFYKDI